jgi:hypothetical protein
MSADRNTQIDSTTAEPPESGQAEVGKWFPFLFMGAFCGGLVFVATNPVTNIYTEWWAAWGIPAVVTVFIALPLWRPTWNSPPGRLTFGRAEPIELGRISGRVVGVLGGLVAGALIGFGAHEALQVIGAALPGTSRVLPAEVVGLEKGSSKNRCLQFATFKYSNNETQEVCVDQRWRASVTDDELQTNESVRMTLKGNALGEWVVAITRDVSEKR